MKRVVPLLILLLASGCIADHPVPSGPVPSERQIRWHEMGYYMFIHFSINTFTGNEWGFGDESPELFNPTDADVDQWARVASEAGMKGIIITAKHHDGFCLWPSAYTEHSVKNSPYRDGNGDILRELREACDRYNLGMGVYLSPWDRNHKDYGTPEYIKYYRNQLTELLTFYGDIFEVWFDGANGGTGYYGGANETRSVDRTTYYDWENTWKLVRELQPLAVMFSDGGPDVRWVGNESGLASPTNWCLLNRDEFYPGSPDYSQLGEGHPDGTHWVPAEVDVSIRPGWFYHESENRSVKSADRLMEIYYSSIGRNANLLLNVPPNTSGQIDQADIDALISFRQRIDSEFSQRVGAGASTSSSGSRGRSYRSTKATDSDPFSFWMAPGEETSGWIEIDFGEKEELNRIVLQEAIKLGQHIDSYRVEAFAEGEYRTVLEGTTIGYRVIRKFPLILTDRIRVSFTGYNYPPAVANIELFRAPGI